MQQINCSSEFPFQLLMEMRKEHPEILSQTQFVITLTGEQMIRLTEMTQKAAEENVERYFERLIRSDVTLKRVTTQQLWEEFRISATLANKLQHDGVLTDIIKVGRQNAYLRSEVLNYLATKRPKAV